MCIDARELEFRGERARMINGRREDDVTSSTAKFLIRLDGRTRERAGPLNLRRPYYVLDAARHEVSERDQLARLRDHDQIVEEVIERAPVGPLRGGGEADDRLRRIGLRDATPLVGRVVVRLVEEPDVSFGNLLACRRALGADDLHGQRSTLPRMPRGHAATLQGRHGLIA
jgi:hypothetical protein